MEALRVALASGAFLEALKALQHTAADGQHARDELHLIRAELVERTGNVVAAERSARELLRRTSINGAAKARCLTLLGMIALEAGRSHEAVDLLSHAISTAEKCGLSEAATWAKLRKLVAVAETSSPAAVSGLLSNLRQAVLGLGHPAITIALHLFVAEIESRRGVTETAWRHLRVANAILQNHRNYWLQGLADIDALCLAFLDSDLGAARLHAERALKVALRSGHRQTHLAAISNLAHIDLAQGQLDIAETRFAQALAMSCHSIRSRVSILDGLAQLETVKGNWEVAQNLLDQASACEVSDLSYEMLSVCVTRVRVLIGNGCLTDAEAHATSALEKAAAVGDFRRVCWLSLLRAEARGLLGRVGDAKRDLETASEHWETLPLDLLAETARVHGNILNAEGSCEAGADELRRFAAIHMLLGHVPPSRHIESIRVTGCSRESRSKESGETPTATVVRSTAAVQLRRAAAAMVLGSRPDILVRELSAMVETAECAANIAIVVIVAGDEPMVVRATNWTNAQACAALRNEECHSIDLGLWKGQRWLLVAFLHASAAALCTWMTIRSLADSSLELAKCRRDGRERQALWPIEEPIKEQHGSFVSERMVELLRVVRRVAPTTITILLTGETGVGKELIARIVHDESRRPGPFVPFNCAAVPRDMLENQLFGHRRGAFTGADESSPGVVRAAAGGTVFLDEVGELPLELQPKILRLLELSEVHPLGESKPVRCDVRIVAATNRDPSQLVKEGSFREDLYYRLNGVTLHVPPLRDRREEIPRLVWQLVDRFAHELQKGSLRVDDEAMEYLVLYDWPGNVRQLINEMRRVVALADSNSVLTAEQLGPGIYARSDLRERGAVAEPMCSLDGPVAAATEQLERVMIERALQRAGGRVEEAARQLGLSRKGLYLKRQRLGIGPKQASKIRVSKTKK
jgi:DNA-binding NtrC family response regulator/tetratricopeptide (TPR) repeat protein